MARRRLPKRVGIGRLAGVASSPVVLRTPVVDADCAGAVGYDLKKAACHDQVFDEVECLVGIVEVRMKERCGGQAEQRQHRRNDTSLIAGNNQKAAPISTVTAPAKASGGGNGRLDDSINA